MIGRIENPRFCSDHGGTPSGYSQLVTTAYGLAEQLSRYPGELRFEYERYVERIEWCERQADNAVLSMLRRRE